NTGHILNDVFARPNTSESFYDIMEKVYSYKLLWGNVFLRVIHSNDGTIESIECLRPDRVTVLSDEHGDVIGYRYKHKKVRIDFPVRGDGSCDIIHIKSFHPLNDIYGLSAMESAKYSIDQHNEASRYAKALLQNSARPSGALVVNATEHNNGGRLTDDQFEKLRNQLYTNHSGATNNGKPLILEGGLDWKEMSMSPKDMDFIENKNSSAREIALAFGVPPQLLGIPGDNTYSNMSEARLALWEHTIIPLMQDVTKTFERAFGNLLKEDDLVIQFDKSQIADVSQKVLGR
ncbi:MAG: phage portal protein, partial [Proteobacteria bacterium]|nr:phage portal protein [Pseudomonadota bacterium]